MATDKIDIHIENSNLQENTNEINFNNDKNEENSEQIDTVETNCLALTVKKDYNLSIFKNTIFTTFRVMCKITISTIILNFLKMFL